MQTPSPPLRASAYYGMFFSANLVLSATQKGTLCKHPFYYHPSAHLRNVSGVFSLIGPFCSPKSVAPLSKTPFFPPPFPRQLRNGFWTCFACSNLVFFWAQKSMAPLCKIPFFPTPLLQYSYLRCFARNLVLSGQPKNCPLSKHLFFPHPVPVLRNVFWRCFCLVI